MMANQKMCGRIEAKKDEILDIKRCHKFIVDHIIDCEKVMKKLEKVHLTLSRAKSMFGVNEVLVVGYMCKPYGYGCKLSTEKVDRI